VERVDTVIVGAGQAGLAVSHLLTAAGVTHVLFERGRVGESWRSQRWDSFTLNTPNWANLLPGWVLGDRDQHAFADRDELVAALEAYAAASSAPIREQTAVTSVERGDDGWFEVATATDRVLARHVVVCSGGLSRARLPAVAARTPADIETLSAASYRNPEALTDGAVVVVGTGQSGCQIAEDLLAAGREVFVCVSQVGRVPRRYRGRDVIDWLVDLGFFDVTVDALDDPLERYAAQPQVSGTRGGHTVSLQSLARDGATLLGRLEDIDGRTLRLAPTVRACVEFADARSAAVKTAIDGYITTHGLDAPPATPDPDEPELPDLGDADTRLTLDLDAAAVSTIIWCVGFDGDLSWLRHDVVDDRGTPRHDAGVSEVPGLYFVGFPWLHKRKSGILLGIEEDARRVVEHLTDGAGTAPGGR
jgi:putative flavoprotein involved in K+ transport